MRKLHKFDKKARDKYAKRYHRFEGIQTWDDLEDVVDSMPIDEQTTLALGFYNYDEAIAEEIEAFELDFDGDDDDDDFDGDDDFDDFTDYVDDDFESFDDDEDDDFDNVITDGDDWIGVGDEGFLNAHHSKRKKRGGKNAFALKGSHHINFNEDGEVGLQAGDDEKDGDFENLLSKKGRKRRKLRRKKRKELKKSGVSRKEARKKARKEARKEIPRDSLKETAKKSWKKIKKVGKAVVNVVKKGALFVPRQAGRGLVQLNYRGIAEKLKKGQGQGKSSKIKSKWKGLGGSMKSLQKAIDKGAKKKPLLCGVKCKGKLHDAVKSNFSGANGEVLVDRDKLMALVNEGIGYSNIEPATLTMIATGSGVVGTLAGVVGGLKASKQNQEMIDNQDENDKQSLEMMGDSQKAEFELMEKQIEQQLNPEEQIWNNPDLSQEEKIKSVKAVREALGDTTGEDAQKGGINPLYIGLGVLAVGGIIFAMTRR